MVRYYGYYSNKSRGMRKKENNDDNAKSELATVESDISRKKFRKNWARLIQKIYNVDPLSCPKCGSEMRIISFIEDDVTIKKILMHLGLWAGRRQGLLLAHASRLVAGKACCSPMHPGWSQARPAARPCIPDAFEP